MRRFGWGILTVLLALGCAREERTQVDVFFTADVQGFYFSRPEPRLDNQEAGGYGVLKNFLQNQTAPYLLFDGGNWFGPSAEGTLTKESYVPLLTQNIPFTAGTLTDRDLAYGWPVARGIVKELAYPLVVANLRLENQIPWPLHDYQIRTVEGIKFGIFGIMAPLEKNQSRLSGLSTLDPIETAQQMTALLQEKGVDYIIVLSSLGISSQTGYTNADLATEVEGIDLILSSNQDNDTPETEEMKQTWVVYPGSKLDSVGRITLQFDKNHQVKETVFADVPLLKNQYGEDEEIAAQAKQLLNQIRSHMKRYVATAVQTIPTDWKAQSALGTVLAQCLHKWAKLDGAILNAASIRSELAQGPLTEFDLYKAYPYGDNITYVTMKGAALTKALQASINNEDNFPQIAGFTVMYADAPIGKKVIRVTLDNGRIVRPNDTYRVAVTDHILAGGFNHDEFINALEFKSTFVEARQIMHACLARQKNITVPTYKDRWKLVK